ncbi:MAG: 7-carboxy-7-deazaguanine synthase QueE [Gammaproteobacteria bacterium]
MLRITEIFYSLQGETNTVGLPTVFIRLTGCPLRCQYCDTDYAFSGGSKMLQEEILAKVAEYKSKYVTVTGGEPLAQKACIPLLSALCDSGYIVSLETSGAIDVRQVDLRVVKILDLKTPASGEVDKNLYENIKYLTPHDQIKFVICNRGDYDWAKKIISEYALANQFEVLFSPSHEELPAKDLAQWILQDHLPVRLQIQLHKYIWGNERGR